MPDRRMRISRATFDTHLCVNRASDHRVMLTLSTFAEEGNPSGPKDRNAWFVDLNESTDFTSDPVGSFCAKIRYTGDAGGVPTWEVSRCNAGGSQLATQTISWDSERGDINFL